MRAVTSLLLLCSACSAEIVTPDPSPPESVRERLELGETQLLISSAESAGAITARRRTGDGWSAGFVELEVQTGEVVASADGEGVITLERLAIDLGPIEIPPSVLGYEAQLTNVKLEIAGPARVATTWSGDDESRGMVELELELSWSLSHHGSTLPLGSPELPLVPVELVLTGDGSVVHAELRLRSPGELWSWADLLKLEELTLILSARTP